MGPPPFLVLYLVGLVSSICYYNKVGKNTQPPTRTDRKRCDASFVGAKEGCTFTLHCIEGSKYFPGYYFQEDPTGDGIDIVCKNGQWTTTDGDDVPKCQRGCTALDKAAMGNATWKMGPPSITYINGVNKLWPLGTKIQTVCKPGYYFSQSKTHQDAGNDYHQCSDNSGSGWEDLNKDPDEQTMAWPAFCRGFCDLIDNSTLPDGVVVIKDPSTVNAYDNKKKVLPVGSIYKFKCKDSYKPKNPAYIDGIQTLQCDGQWRDTITGKGQAAVLQCAANGCPAITSQNIPSHTVNEQSTDCHGDVKMDGCKVTIRCSKNDGTPSGLGWYMPEKPTGYTLTCNKGAWLDENGKPVLANSNGVYPGNCQQGCTGLFPNDATTTAVIIYPSSQGNPNEDVVIYPPNSQITTLCKDSYIRPGMLNQGNVNFICTTTGWVAQIPYLHDKNIYPATCVPACSVTESPGVDQTVAGEIYIKNGSSQWVQQGSSMKRKCQSDYSPASGQSQPQNLVCVGGSAGWLDPIQNKTNEIGLQCVIIGSPGCVPVPDNSGVNYTYSGNCTLINGFIPKTCIVSIHCLDGYFPDGTVTMTPAGWQNVSCTAGVDGYTDLITGQSNTTLMKCTQACLYSDSYSYAKIVVPAQTSDFFPQTYAGQRYIKPKSVVTMTCKPLQDGYYWNNEADKNRVEQQKLTNFSFKCLGGPSKYEKETNFQQNLMPGDMCGPVCDYLDSSNTKPDSVTFWTSSKKYAVNAEFTVKCKAGYEFPKGSDEAIRGYQRLFCLGGTKNYQDEDTGRINAQPTQCLKSPEPRCPVIDTNSTLTQVTTIEGDCRVESGGILNGCTINITCPMGFFPSTGFVGTSASSQLVCKKQSQSVAVWVDYATQMQAPMPQCTQGCALLPLNGHSQVIVDSPIATVAGVTYYQPTAEITIQCLSRYMPRTETGWTIQEGSSGMRYKCDARIPDMPWMNLKTYTLEQSPFLVCVKSCVSLESSIPVGVAIETAPGQIITNSGAQIVNGGGMYVLHCKQGYHYDPARPNGTQKLYCDPDTGVYTDISKTGTNITSAVPSACTKDNPPNCNDLPVQNGKLLANCINGYPNGCKATVTCNPNFAPKDPHYNITGKQQLVCQDGQNWLDTTNNIAVTQAMECIPVCEYLVKTKTSSSTSTSITILMNNTTYIPTGSEVTVKCVGDGVIWIDNVNETNTEHTYKCIGGGANYTKTNGNGQQVSIPGSGCISTCSTLPSPTDPTLTVKLPPTVIWDGQQLVSDGQSYTFSCRKGFVYQTGKPNQVFKCNGITRKFYDTTTNIEYTQPTSCIIDPNGDYCPALNFNMATTLIDSPAACQTVTSQNNTYYNSGCQINVKCKNNYYPANQLIYNSGAGWQNLTCQPAGDGWTDQFGNHVTEPMTCVTGCINDTTPTTKPNTATRSYDQYWLNPLNITTSVFKAKCFVADQYNASVVKNSVYSCPVTPDYYNDFCENACRQLPANYPTGVIANITGYKLDSKLDYVYATAFYQFICAPGYSYPTGTPYAAVGHQILQCNGTTHMYDDNISGQKNVTVVETCLPNQGCQELPKGDNSVGPTIAGSCSSNNGRWSENCVLSYKCQQGFYPSNAIYYLISSQDVKCNPGGNSWNLSNTLTSGQLVTKTLDCISGCLPINKNTIEKILSQLNISINTQPYPSITPPVDQLRCYTVNTVNNVTTIIDTLNKLKNPYVCPDSLDSSQNVKYNNLSFCESTCKALQLSTPTGTTVTKPPIFNPYGNQELVKNGASYVFQCASNYEFPSTNNQPPPTIQKLTCQSDGNYFNPNTQQKTTNPPTCQPVQKKQCDKPSGQNIILTYSPNCANQNPTDIGCQLSAQCAPNSYPSDSSQLFQSIFNYTCSSVNGDSPVFRNTANSSQLFSLSCTPGCANGGTIGNYTSLTQSWSISNGNTNVSCYRSNAIIANIPSDIQKYFCEYTGQNGITGFSKYICNNVCSLLRPSAEITFSLSGQGQALTNVFDITYTLLSSNAYYNVTDHLIFETTGSSVTFSCPPGHTFIANQQNSRTLNCGSDYYFRENGNIIGDLGGCQ